jgi:drug/metabolite transporter (DMT)-like permease
VPLAVFVPVRSLGAISATGWAALGFLAIVCTIFGFLVWSWALRKTEAARLGSLVYMIPLVTIISEMIVMKTVPGAGLLLGGMVLIFGVIVAET